MGILANTVSICQFTVAGDLPAGDLYPWIAERLARHAFQSIDEGTAELSIGWVHLDDHKLAEFASPAHFWRDRQAVFTLRRDQRRVPAAIFKAHLHDAQQEFLSRNPGFSRVPKRTREELAEAVKERLRARTLPTPSTWDVVWDTQQGIVTFTALSSTVIELFETEFKRTFDGLRLQMIHPFARGLSVTAGETAEALNRANRAGSEAALDLIRCNRWLGEDFLLWLLYRTMQESGEYRVTRPGIAVEGEGFVAYLNDRLVLVATAGETVQKITVAGPQDHFSEVRTALRNGKTIVDATLYLERGEDIWRLTLRGELFHFASLRGPAVRIERDNTVNELDERESVFHERMHILGVGLQLFDSLYGTFLNLRLSGNWSTEEEKISRWLEEE
jgi:hypothetical protein